MKKIRFTQYLKLQLAEIVESYRKYFLKTLGITILFTIACFIGAVLLLRYTKFGPMVTDHQFSLLGYLFHRFSTHDDYALVDLTKSLFLYFVTLFAIGLSSFEAEPGTEITFLQFMKRVNPDHAVIMLLVLLGVCGMDFGLTKLIHVPENRKLLEHYDVIFNKYIFHSRIYLPLIFFSIAFWRLTVKQRTSITIKRLIFLYISLWIVNEMAYESSLWMRNYVFEWMTTRTDDPEKYFLYESFLSVPLIAFYMTGYCAVIASSLRFSEPELPTAETAATDTLN